MQIVAMRNFEKQLSPIKKLPVLPIIAVLWSIACMSPSVAFASDGKQSTAKSSDVLATKDKKSAPLPPVSEMDRLLAILVEKKVLSTEEAASVRTEVKEQEQQSISSNSPGSQSKTVAQSQETTAQSIEKNQASELKKDMEEVAEKLPFRISGFAQVQWNSLPGSGSTFQLRRGRISIDGDIHKIAAYKIQVEALNSPTLLDAYLQVKPRPYANLTFGQFKIPFSQENLISSSDLLTIERSQVVNNLVPGRDNGSNGRDIGADFGGSMNFSDSSGFDYAIGIFNGAGINRKDDNNRKDLATRLGFRPFRGILLAGDYYNGAAGPTEIPRDRQGAEFDYTYHPLTLLGEFIWGRDGAIHKQGWYGLTAWRFSKEWEGVFRADAYDPDRSKALNTTITYLGGFNWNFAPGLKWQLDDGAQNKLSQIKNVFLSQLQFKF